MVDSSINSFSKDTFSYLLTFLVGKDYEKYIVYKKNYDPNAKLTIIQSDFFNKNIYGTQESLPKLKLDLLPNSNSIPFLYGSSKLERTQEGNYILYADLIASSYFMLSRYEEFIKKDKRDLWGRFLAKDSDIFKSGYGITPLVDEWSLYLKDILRKTGINIPTEKKGFSHIYLTHDVDFPFMLFNKRKLIKQIVKKILKKDNSIKHPIKTFLTGEDDPFFTFDKIINYDSQITKNSKSPSDMIYFIIARKGKEYCSIKTEKFKLFVTKILKNNAKIGLHVSHEGGISPLTISNEFKELRKYIPAASNISRHHFLRWREPEHIEYIESANIMEDFTLSYPDCAGFRTGTCRPYLFINPKTQSVTNVIIHPLQIMECTLSEKKYMNLDYNKALVYCKNLIQTVYDHNGELNILWHNTSFMDGSYHDKLYSELLNFIKKIF